MDDDIVVGEDCFGGKITVHKTLLWGISNERISGMIQANLDAKRNAERNAKLRIIREQLKCNKPQN